MVDKELHKLKRIELLEIMITLSEENEVLRSKIKSLEEQLANRIINIEESGSIAEASLKISGIFKVAQDAADLYLENIKTRFEVQKSDVKNGSEHIEKGLRYE